MIEGVSRKSFAVEIGLTTGDEACVVGVAVEGGEPGKASTASARNDLMYESGPHLKFEMFGGRKIAGSPTGRASRGCTSIQRERPRAESRSTNRARSSARSTMLAQADNCCIPRKCKAPPTPSGARNSEIRPARHGPQRTQTFPNSKTLSSSWTCEQATGGFIPKYFASVLD